MAGVIAGAMNLEESKMNEAQTGLALSGKRPYS
jgi:hypothetical protein